MMSLHNFLHPENEDLVESDKEDPLDDIIVMLNQKINTQRLKMKRLFLLHLAQSISTNQSSKGTEI